MSRRVFGVWTMLIVEPYRWEPFTSGLYFPMVNPEYPPWLQDPDSDEWTGDADYDVAYVGVGAEHPASGVRRICLGLVRLKMSDE